MSAPASTIENTSEDRHEHYHVVVSYNGTNKPFEVSAHETVGTLLKAAIEAFHVGGPTHTLSLFTRDNVELQDGASLEGAGVGPGSHLLLRPSTVKGGHAPGRRIA